MHRALQLAKLGIGNVAPNPLVGCVIVHENEIIGEGWHQKYGEAHAEVNAINSTINSPIGGRGANYTNLSEPTVYVSLEPCSHFGKTPPCADLLIKHQVKKVVVCNLDPNPLVAGKGIEKLKNAGIEVEIGILEKEGREINKRFFTFIEKKRPYIILKWAQTADGFIAGENGAPIQISNEFSSKIVHKMRAENAAIMVGTNTALNDNPSLTTRNWHGKNPIRVLIDKQLRFKQTMNIFNEEADSLVYNLHGSAMLTTGGNGNIAIAEYIQLSETDDFLKDLIQDLYHRNIQSILVEGGPKLLESFLGFGLWDEALVIVSEKQIESGIKAPDFNFLYGKMEKIENDMHFLVKNLSI